MPIEFLKHIICPCCRATDRYQISLGNLAKEQVRVILDCRACDYRLSLPFDMEKFEKEYQTMPLEFDGSSKVSD